MVGTGTRIVIAAVCLSLPGVAAAQGRSLEEERKGFKTRLTKRARTQETLPTPPAGLFEVVSYPTKLGSMKALLGRPRDRTHKHPAIVWVAGGFPAGGMDKSAWTPVSAKNDQSAKVYRQAGVVMMYPTLRGTYGNPGVQEAFLGEVDDVVAAGDYLSKLSYVDPKRIYLGGHSTGGTLVLLAAATTRRFRAVFSFGPVEDPSGYGASAVPYDVASSKESRVRAPIHYLGRIRTPTWVIEGTQRGNVSSLRAIARASRNPKLTCVAVSGANHFDLLAPINTLIATQIARGGALALDRRAIQGAYDSPPPVPSPPSPAGRRTPAGPDSSGAQQTLRLLEEVRNLIPKLGTPSPSKTKAPQAWKAARAVRKRAARRLQEIGRPALPDLRKASRDRRNATLRKWASYVIKKIEAAKSP